MAALGNFAVVLGLVMAMVAGKQIAFQDCGSQGARIVGMSMTPCDVEPCEFKRGVNIVTEVDFVSTVRSSRAHMVAVVLAGGNVIPLPIDDPNACDFIACPLVPGKLSALRGNKTVPADVPPVPIPLAMQLRIFGDRNETILCTQYAFKV
ncbi:NPC intracellular cholesterol transporter 2-like [Paramacrobiotus metropolitanus]|uniref:NPC intracellular cholesterol transporter 2-like n=1 Tax=Paramacrobiotus metropolitanus TaxID=2943436 RepID=UPI0024465432|nr:NPC intracellular cholesterol transporter 2-like [Paramacrobiotus metropolitanus]